MATAVTPKLDKNPPVIRRPLVTEKSTAGASASRPAYTFVVAPGANKIMVHRAVIERYKVTPTKINISVVKGKKVFTRGRAGRRGGFKKAMVYLKPGDKIEL